MQILVDKEILALVQRSTPIITGLTTPADWFSEDSPVQPTSVDLSAGRIFLPPSDDQGREPNGAVKDYVTLHPGQTALVETREKLNLPEDLCGIGFSPSRLAVNGLLLANPGHIDPSSKGPLHLTVINVGRQIVTLRSGDKVFSLILLRLDQKPTRGLNLSDRTYRIGRILRHLAPDFLNIERRATELARQQVQKESLKGQALSVFAPVLAALIAAVGTIFASNYLPLTEKVESAQQEVRLLKERVTAQEKLREVELKMSALEQRGQLEPRIIRLEEAARRGSKLK